MYKSLLTFQSHVPNSMVSLLSKLWFPHPISPDALYLHRRLQVFPHFLGSGGLIRRWILSPQASKTSWPSWTIAILKVIVVEPILGVVDGDGSSFGRARRGHILNGGRLGDGSQERVIVGSESRRIARDESLRRGHSSYQGDAPLISWGFGGRVFDQGARATPTTVRTGPQKLEETIKTKTRDERVPSSVTWR